MEKEKINEKGYPERKPDKETESLRMWKVDRKNYKANPKDYPVINYEGMEIGLGGFDIIYDKPITDPNKKVMLALKFKDDLKNILYYLSDEATEEHKQILETIRVLAFTKGYSMSDSKEMFKNMKIEWDIMNKKNKGSLK